MAEQRIKLAKRLESPLILLYIDVDNFKAINDTHGHNVGDNILSHLARILKTNIRESDIVARMGGDEFVVLILPKNKDDIQKIKQKIGQTVRDYRHTELPLFTATVGATLVNKVSNIEQLLDQADKDMLTQKKYSRN